MTHAQNHAELTTLVQQLRAYGRYFQAAGLEEVGPMVKSRKKLHQTNVISISTPTDDAPAAAPVDSAAALKCLRDEIGDCTRCRLHEGRTHLVFGTGNPRSKLMFVGEAPGQDEDQQGLPFVGRAGQLLTKMIESMGFRREDVYIANVIKCRPPGNRAPRPDEVATCEPFLRRQIAMIHPEVVCALGSHATQAVLRRPEKISQVRGRFFLVDAGDPVIDRVLAKGTVPNTMDFENRMEPGAHRLGVQVVESAVDVSAFDQRLDCGLVNVGLGVEHGVRCKRDDEQGEGKRTEQADSLH